MEISLPHTQLKQTLELVSRISTKHITLPVLQCVRITATADSIVFQATNLEISISVPIAGTVSEPGDVAVPTQVFLQSIQFITESQITLRHEDGVLQVESKTGTTTIKTFSTDEFPTIHQLSGEGSELQAAAFAYGIKTTAFAASQASIKPELGSVFITQKREHSVTMVATDSFRLMEKTVTQKQLVLEQSIMIPSKNALELARVCEVINKNPRCIINDNACALVFPDGTYISSRLVTGSFPDYVQIIPKEFICEVTVLKEDLLRLFKKTSVFLNKFRQVSLTITTGHITASAQNSEIGQVTDTIPASVVGEEIALNFNQQYLLDSLTHITDESLMLRFAGVGRALIIQGVNDTSVRYLVMPMNR